MSVLSRLIFVDDRSAASSPGGISLQPLRYARHFPLWPVSLAGGFLAGAGAGFYHGGFWIAGACLAALNLVYWLHIRARFRFGCVNPGLVVSTSPFLLAVSTDLTTGGPAYPVVKILRHPAPAGAPWETGQRCATIATYTGAPEADHWEDFDPVMVECATNDPAAIESIQAGIPAVEWSNLETGMKQVPLPLKPGIYPVTLPNP